MQTLRIAAFACIVAVAAGSISAKDNYRPVSITVDQAPFDILATPITPDAPYSQKEYQCNLTGDSRYPPYAFGTFPLDISVPLGKRVRVIFANGNLNGDTTTLFGEPGVIVQQGGAPIVQQAGGASPIVQKPNAPIVQQHNAPPNVMIVQQTPTVVDQPTWPAAPSVPAAPIIDQGVSTPVPTTTPAPTTTPVPSQPPMTLPTPGGPGGNNGTPGAPGGNNGTSGSPGSNIGAPGAPATAGTPGATSGTPGAPGTSDSKTPPPAAAKLASSQTQSPPVLPTLPLLPPTEAKSFLAKLSPVSAPAVSNVASAPAASRKLLQDTVPGGLNNGLVEYVALANASSTPGFYAGSTQFGVPYIEFTATEAAKGQVASFQGVLEVAQVIGGVPQYPFRPNPSLSPECQVNVNFRVAGQ